MGLSLPDRRWALGGRFAVFASRKILFSTKPRSCSTPPFAIRARPSLASVRSLVRDFAVDEPPRAPVFV